MIANLWTELQLFFGIAAMLASPAGLGLLALAVHFGLTAAVVVVAAPLVVREKLRERRERRGR